MGGKITAGRKLKARRELVCKTCEHRFRKHAGCCDARWWCLVADQAIDIFSQKIDGKCPQDKWKEQ